MRESKGEKEQKVRIKRRNVPGVQCVRVLVARQLAKNCRRAGANVDFFPVNCLCRRLFAAVAANTGAMRLLFVLLQFPPGVGRALETFCHPRSPLYACSDICSSHAVFVCRPAVLPRSGNDFQLCRIESLTLRLCAARVNKARPLNAML